MWVTKMETFSIEIKEEEPPLVPAMDTSFICLFEKEEVVGNLKKRLFYRLSIVFTTIYFCLFENLANKYNL